MTTSQAPEAIGHSRVRAHAGSAVRLGRTAGWRGNEPPTSPDYLRGYMDGARLRALAERLGFYRPHAGMPFPPREERKRQRAYLRAVQRQLARGETFESAVARLGPPLP